MKFTHIIFCILAFILISGCDSPSSVPYRASTDNALKMQSKLSGLDQQIAIAPFTLAEALDVDRGCRMLGNIDATAGKSFEEYVQGAYKDELFLAKLYDPNATLSLQGELNQIEFSTMGGSDWKLGILLRTNLFPEGIEVTTLYDFKGSFSAINACQNAANAFGPAVESLIRASIDHPDFVRLFKSE